MTIIVGVACLWVQLTLAITYVTVEILGRWIRRCFFLLRLGVSAASNKTFGPASKGSRVRELVVLDNFISTCSPMQLNWFIKGRVVCVGVCVSCT
jgi:hypothetical protein